jgi:hypothetical protein
LMAAPHPLRVVHFTHVEHLPGIVAVGVLPDNEVRAQGRISTEVGNAEIKARRRGRPVPCHPGGTVADYVPFYFAPRSPMLYAIDRGSVPTYQDGCDRLVYLVARVERFIELGLEVVMTDRNAVLQVASFTNYAEGVPDDMIDWDLMRATYWGNTSEQPDRRERRMAECLVYPRVPWEAIDQVTTKTETTHLEATRSLANATRTVTVNVRRNWYF